MVFNRDVFIHFFSLDFKVLWYSAVAKGETEMLLIVIITIIISGGEKDTQLWPEK